MSDEIKQPYCCVCGQPGTFVAEEVMKIEPKATYICDECYSKVQAAWEKAHPERKLRIIK